MNLSDKDNNSHFVYEKLSRREARSLIFHLIYAIEGFSYAISLEAIVDSFNRGFDLDIPSESEVLHIAKGVVEESQELDKIIEPLLDNWRLERIGVCTKLILRLSIWEIKNTDTPSSVVINEAIELAKCFSEKDAYRFVNGILDEVCKKYRPDEELVSQENNKEDSKEDNKENNKENKKKTKKVSSKSASKKEERSNKK